MELPNSYGSVIKLGGKRRKPYAVRISKLVEDDTGKVKRKYTYLAYFAKPEMAYTYLAEYNSGAVVPEHMKYSDSPTFAEMYEKWKKYRKSLKNQISASHGEIMRLLFIISASCKIGRASCRERV